MEQLNLDGFKADIHRILISRLDLEKLSRVNSNQARQAVAGLINDIIAEQKVPLSFEEQEQVQPTDPGQVADILKALNLTQRLPGAVSESRWNPSLTARTRLSPGNSKRT